MPDVSPERVAALAARPDERVEVDPLMEGVLDLGHPFAREIPHDDAHVDRVATVHLLGRAHDVVAAVDDRVAALQRRQRAQRIELCVRGVESRLAPFERKERRAAQPVVEKDVGDHIGLIPMRRLLPALRDHALGGEIHDIVRLEVVQRGHQPIEIVIAE